jgi:hypothetical protein
MAEARSVKLDVGRTAPRKPLVHFLDRLCTAAEAGRLRLRLHANCIDRTDMRFLSQLLAPSQQGGWPSIRELKLEVGESLQIPTQADVFINPGILSTHPVWQLQGFPGGSTPAKLVASAFPALQKLVINFMPLTFADLSSLTACSQLSSLDLCICQLQPSGDAGHTSPLSAVASLRQLSLWDTVSNIAAGLTQLTSLSLRYRQEAVADCLVHIRGLTQLQSLELGDVGDPHITVAPKEVLTILESCKQLTSLTLNTLQQAHFDALLTSAPQLTSLTCSSLCLQQDRSASQCGLKELVFMNTAWDSKMVAYLPIAGVTRLAFQGDHMELPSPSPTMKIWSDKSPHLMHQGLLNLTRCPAWRQCGPMVQVTLLAVGRSPPEQQALILGALAPLSSREVKLTIVISECLTGACIIQQLGGALGSSLKRLVLGDCDLSDDFWPAVWAHLPGLQQLTVTDKVRGSIGPQQITSFCSQAVRPLQFNLRQGLYEQFQAGAQLNTAGGVPQVTVAKFAGN